MEIKNALEKELKKLYNLEAIVNERLDEVPEGSLHIYKTEHRVQYYHKLKPDTSGKSKRIYLRQDELQLKKALAQKDYDQRIMHTIQEQRKTIERFLSEYNLDQLKDFYTNLSPERKELIQAEIVDDEEYSRRWMERDYLPGKFETDAPEYFTKKMKEFVQKVKK